MNIVFVLSYLPDPRTNKRIETAKKVADVSVICWNRMNNAIWAAKDLRVNNIEIKINAAYENPLKRLLQTINYITKALNQLKRLKPQILYVGNVDMLFIAYLYNLGKRDKAKIFYEIADLNSLILDKQKGIKYCMQSILKICESVMCKKVSRLILTSEKFYDVYYKSLISNEKVIFMPNIPDHIPFTGFTKKEDEAFTVGFIGYIRYERQLKMLIDASREANVRVFLAGSGIKSEIEEYCRNKPNVKYYGNYNYDNDIAKLYGKVDCIYAVYDAGLANVRIALPNKLYESVYCSLPIIVSKGTYLAELVQQMGVGVAVSHNDPSDLIEELKKLSRDSNYYSKFVNNCKTHKHEISADTFNIKLIEAFKENM